MWRAKRAEKAPPPPTHRPFSWSIDGHLFAVAFVATGCLVWTVWIMLLTIAPNATVNWLMDTKTFDEGSYWRFIDPQQSALLLGFLGLSCVALAYLYIIVRVTTLRNREFSSWSKFASIQSIQSKRMSVHSAKIESRRDSRVASAKLAVMGVVTKSSKIVKEERAKLNVALKFVDLGIQLYLLIEMMEKGLPIVIIGIFTSVIVLNALITAVTVAGLLRQTGLPELLLDTVFDLMVAVGLPMLVLLYCMTTFHFNRRLLAINLEVFPPGWFERGASVNSDPVQPEIIRSSLNSLRIFSVMSVFARVGTNCSLCHRFYQLAALIKDPIKRRRRIYSTHRPSAIAFVLIAVVTIIFVEESIRTSSVACQPHPECVQHACRWIVLSSDHSLTQCPCLTLIDVHPAVKTYDEWLSPPSAFEKLSQLATSGDLEMVSLLSRQLSTLPDELRKCKHLRHLALVYTDTETLPTWTKELTKLEYLHIEGKFSLDRMVEMPNDMFEGMLSLTFLHLAALHVSSIPPMKALSNLKYFVLAQLLHLQELPSFEGLKSLETLVLAVIPLVDSIPDTSPLVSLQVFATLDRGSFCCNGFLGECDLTNSLCMYQELFDIPPAVCLPPNRTTKLLTAAIRDIFAKFWYMACADQANKPGDLETGPTRETSDACGGIMYRQCEPPVGGIGMCYSTRMMGIACGRNGLAQVMRRRQIAEGVGEPCDPKYESWLGCESRSVEVNQY